jgi:hypothetical protein
MGALTIHSHLNSVDLAIRETTVDGGTHEESAIEQQLARNTR